MPVVLEYWHPSCSLSELAHTGVTISLISRPLHASDRGNHRSSQGWVTPPHFHFDQKHKSASEIILSFEIKTSCSRPVGNFWAPVLNHWLVWQRVELGPLPSMPWWQKTMQPCRTTSVDTFALLTSLSLTLTGSFLSPAITSLFLSPYFPHSFVSKDAQVSLTFPNFCSCGRMKWLCCIPINSGCHLILNFSFIGSLRFFNSFKNSSLQTNT